MDTADTNGGSLHDWMIIQEVKALTEKLHLLTQDRSTPKTYQPVHAEPSHPGAADADVASDSSGFSMFTPFSTIEPEHDEDESRLEQRDLVREMIDGLVVTHDLGLGHSKVGRGNVGKTAGFVIGFEEGVDVQQGQEILRFASGHQHLSFELRSGKLSSIANGGEDSQHLSAARSKSRERDTRGIDVSGGGGGGGGDSGTHPRRTGKRCNIQEFEERPGFKATGEASVLLHRATPVNSTDMAVMPSDDPSTFPGREAFQNSTQDASNDTSLPSQPTDRLKTDTSNTNKTGPICKPVECEERTALDTLRDISYLQTELVAASEAPVLSLLRRAIRLNSGDMFIASWFGLFFLAISLVRYVVVLSAESRGHCVGIWLGS